MANVGPTTWYVRDNAPTSTIGWSAVTAWAATTAKTAGQLVRQLAAPTVGNERVFACIIAGTTLGSEPAWTVTKGAKTAEAAGPTWIEVTGQPGVNGDTTNSPTWLQNKNTAITLGLIIYDSVSAALQIVTTAGTTGNGAAPSFSATAGTTTADNTVTWTSLGLASGFAAWAAPAARLALISANNSAWNVTSPTTVFVADDHSETQASNMTLTSNGPVWTNVYSVDHTASLPPSGSLLKGATVATTGNTSVTFGTSSTNFFQYFWGINFNHGSGANSPAASIGVANNGCSTLFDNCKHSIVATGSSATLSLGGGSWYGRIVLNNTQISFGAAGQSIVLKGSNVVWRNTASAIQGTTPTNLFTFGQGIGGVIEIDGVDFSALGSGKTIFAAANSGFRVVCVDCEFGASVTVAATPSNDGATVDVVSSDSAATTYQAQRYWVQAVLTPSTALIRTGGASDGTTGVSWQIATTANAQLSWANPFASIPISIWNTVTGTNRGVAIQGTYKGAALPKNDEIWLEVEYLGNASFPLASFATQTKANGLATGSALSADTASDWTGQAAAYQTANAYGAFTGFIKAGNATPQQVFFMASHSGTGTSGGSTTIFNGVADGAQVTDNAGANQIVWQAMMRFTLTVTLSSPQPQLAGVLRAAVKAALPSTTWWVDPSPTLS